MCPVWLGPASPEAVAALLGALHKAGDWWTRQDAAACWVGWAADEETVQALWYGLQDSASDVRTACAEALTALGRRFPQAAGAIAQKLAPTIRGPYFAKPAQGQDRTGHDYAFDGLWLLLSGGPPRAA